MWENEHYSDVIRARWRLKLPAWVFIQPFIRAQIKENIKAPRHWPLCGEFTGHRWIPRTKGQQRGKCFHLMMSSWNDDVIKSSCAPVRSDQSNYYSWNMLSSHNCQGRQPSFVLRLTNIPQHMIKFHGTNRKLLVHKGTVKKPWKLGIAISSMIKQILLGRLSIWRVLMDENLNG